MLSAAKAKEMPGSPPKSVLITGASSGIGRACALRMDRAGWQVIATVRKPEDARQLRLDASERLHTMLLDVTDSAQIAQTARAVGDLVGGAGLHGLVNNAGIAGGGLLEFVDPEDLRRILNVNTVAPVAVTQALIPLLRKAQGSIVMISSEAGFSSTPLASPIAPPNSRSKPSPTACALNYDLGGSTSYPYSPAPSKLKSGKKRVPTPPMR